MLYTAGSPKGRELSLDDLPPPTPEPTLQHHLIACLERGEPPVPWPRVAFHRDVVEIVDAGLRSIKTGLPIHLPLPLPLMQAGDWV